MRTSFLMSGMGLILALSASHALAASKPGLWDITMNMTLANMPQIPPEAMAQMRALGMSVPGMGGAPIRSQVCQTPAQAAAEEPPAIDKSCRNQNIRRNGQTISGELVCTGELNGRGTFEHTQVSDEQYRSKVSFKGTRQGQPTDFTADLEGHWAAASCGSVAPSPP